MRSVNQAGLSRRIVGFVFFGTAILVSIRPLAEAAHWPDALGGALWAAAVVAVQLLFLYRPVPDGLRAVPHLLAQAALTYAPLLWFGPAWVTVSGFLAGNLLLTLNRIPAVAGVGVVVALSGLIAAYANPFVADPATVAVPTAVLATLVVGLVVHALTQAARWAEDRGELARWAVTEERLRFSRDTHDLLGLSLSAITLKSELTNRLIVEQPQRAQAELAEILVMSRKALADVRSVAAGYRELSLAEECRAAGAVLRAAEIVVRLDCDPAALACPASTTLATVLREGVTNILRHSEATWCEITVRMRDGSVLLELVNDGVTVRTASASGCGIGNLAYRVGASGGDLRAGVRRDGTHRLSARVPLETPERAAG
ncbi:sensor histidine kinase [Amycolatopsis pittospori]|uniref:sensor histidine kinase n=1 Tax=Amycolatopsis pittospori TaxID=2749434 RepID=UPI0015F0CBCD|nr:histidine kinase [Amycolatopsis pittospori]